MCWSYYPRLISDRYCQDADAIVVGEGQRSGAGGHIERVRKKIRVSIWLGAAVGGAALRAEPGDVRALNETGTQSDHLAVRIRARSYWGAGRGAWSLWNWI